MSRRETISDFTRSFQRNFAREPVRHVDEQKPPEITKDATSYIDIKRPSKRVKPALPRQDKSKVLTRQGLKKLPPFVPKKTKRHPKRWFVTAGFTLVVLAGMFTASQTVFEKEKSPNQDVKSAVTNPGGGNGQKPSRAVYDSYAVESDMPRYLRVPRLGVDTIVKPIDAKGDLDAQVTSDIYDAGWYDASSKPSDGGVALIAGYVAGPNKEGVFVRIGSIQVGDRIEVEMGNKQIAKYKVIKTKTYERDAINMKELLAPLQPGKESLNLLSVTDRYDIRTTKYEQRIAVFAVRD